VSLAVVEEFVWLKPSFRRISTSINKVTNKTNFVPGNAYLVVVGDVNKEVKKN
jgi:hypothetical protein